jgi:hypothetical protein
VPRPFGRRVSRRLLNSVPATDLVPSAGRLPSARTIGLSLGAGRTAVGAIFFSAPVASVRLLGLDTATAARVSWLARMTAVRDGVLGAGTLVSSGRQVGAGGWLLAGSVSDAVDAAVLVAALRAGKVGGWRPRIVAAGAVAAAFVAAAGTVKAQRDG